MAYLTIISQGENNWCALTPELSCIGTAKTRETLIEHAREAIALALEDRPHQTPTITSVEQLDPDTRADMDASAEVLYLEPAAMNPVSLEIEAALEGAGISQAELARRLGTSRSAVSRMVNPFYWGHSMDLLRRVAQVLGMKVEIKLSAA